MQKKYSSEDRSDGEKSGSANPVEVVVHSRPRELSQLVSDHRNPTWISLCCEIVCELPRAAPLHVERPLFRGIGLLQKHAKTR